MIRRVRSSRRDSRESARPSNSTHLHSASRFVQARFSPAKKVAGRSEAPLSSAIPRNPPSTRPTSFNAVATTMRANSRREKPSARMRVSGITPLSDGRTVVARADVGVVTVVVLVFAVVAGAATPKPAAPVRVHLPRRRVFQSSFVPRTRLFARVIIPVRARDAASHASQSRASRRVHRGRHFRRLVPLAPPVEEDTEMPV